MLKPLLPLAFTASIFLTACGGSSSSAPTAVTSSDNKSPVTETVSNEKLGMNLDLAQLKSAGVFADKIIVKIMKGDFTKTIETTHTDYAASVEFSDLVVGEYAISVQIFDGETLVAEGAGTGAVNQNQTTTVNMDLELKSGGLIVNINVPDVESDKTNLAGEISVTTTTHKINGVEIDVMPLSLLGIRYPVPLFDLSKYNNSAAYAQIEVGTELSLDFNVVLGSDRLPISKVTTQNADNRFAFKDGDNTILGCSACELTIEYNLDTKVVVFTVPVPLDGLESITSVATGEVIEDRFGNTEEMSRDLAHTGSNLVIVFTPINGSSIPFAINNVENLVDKTKYEMSINTRMNFKGNTITGLVMLHPSLRDLKAKTTL